MYVFDAASQCCVFTLGIDACEPEEHGVERPLVVNVGNQNVHFLETIICTTSNNMVFHEHRLKPLDVSNQNLVAKAVQNYCSKLQALPSRDRQQEALLPVPSSSSFQARSPRRTMPYPDAASIQQRRLVPLSIESSTDTALSPDLAASIPSEKLVQSRQESSMGSASLSRMAPVMPLEKLPSSRSETVIGSALHSDVMASMPSGSFVPPESSMDSASSSEIIPASSLIELLKQPLRSSISLNISPRESGDSRLGSSTHSASVASLWGLEDPRPEPSSVFKTLRKPVTDEMKDIITEHCINNYVGRSGYYAHAQLENAVKDGLVKLDFVPSRSTIETILEERRYIKTHIDNLECVRKVITADKQPQQPAQEAPQQSLQEQQE